MAAVDGGMFGAVFFYMTEPVLLGSANVALLDAVVVVSVNCDGTSTPPVASLCNIRKSHIMSIIVS